MRWISRALSLLLAVVLVAACSGDDDAETTTTAAEDDGQVTTLPPAGGGGGNGNGGGEDGDGGQTTTTVDLEGGAVPEFEIVSRDEGDDGDTLVVVLDSTSYDRLTDIDIQNIASRVVEDFPPVSVAHFVDDESVSDVVLTPGQADDEQAQLLDVHYLAELVDGRLTFRGPFADSGVVILGS